MISWTDRVRNEVLHTVREVGWGGGNRKKASWIGHILHRNCIFNTILKER